MGCRGNHRLSTPAAFKSWVEALSSAVQPGMLAGVLSSSGEAVLGVSPWPFPPSQPFLYSQGTHVRTLPAVEDLSSSCAAEPDMGTPELKRPRPLTSRGPSDWGSPGRLGSPGVGMGSGPESWGPWKLSLFLFPGTQSPVSSSRSSGEGWEKDRQHSLPGVSWVHPQGALASPSFKVLGLKTGSSLGPR